MVVMGRQMFTASWLAGLVVATSGCAVVGYPAPVGAPATVSANRAPPHSRDSGDVIFANVPARAVPETVAPRTYEVLGRSYTTLPTASGYREVGIASWYG